MALKVSAPGRVCLFGEHQDFLGLPVIAAAVDLRIYVEGTPRVDRLLSIDMPDIAERDVIDVARDVTYTKGRDYLRSCVKVLRRGGWELKTGYDCRIHTTIPINAGVSSSSALTVAWLKFLIEAAGVGADFPPDHIARLAHQAEVVEFGEPGGMMDHFAAAMGRIIFVDCRPPFHAVHLPVELDGFVVGDSLERKETLGVLSDSKSDVQEGLRHLSRECPGFDLHATDRRDVEPLLAGLPDRAAGRIRANLVNRDLTVEAMRLLREGLDRVRLGELFTKHHEQLRDGIRVSTAKIDRMLEAALAAGALGGKINGSGGGGCMFAYAPGREAEVAEALERAGGRAYPVTVDDGARSEA